MCPLCCRQKIGGSIVSHNGGKGKRLFGSLLYFNFPVFNVPGDNGKIDAVPSFQGMRVKIYPGRGRPEIANT